MEIDKLKIFSCRLTPEMIDQIKKICDEKGLIVQRFVSEALQKHIEDTQTHV